MLQIFVPFKTKSYDILNAGRERVKEEGNSDSENSAALKKKAFCDSDSCCN